MVLSWSASTLFCSAMPFCSFAGGSAALDLDFFLAGVAARAGSGASAAAAAASARKRRRVRRVERGIRSLPCVIAGRMVPQTAVKEQVRRRRRGSSTRRALEAPALECLELLPQIGRHDDALLLRVVVADLDGRGLDHQPPRVALANLVG